MSNELVSYNDIERMALAVAKSGLFGVKTPDQALALMLVAQAEGRHPALAARDYDIIQGRPAKKSEAMLRDFLDGGGKVVWHKLDDTVAEATFSHPAGGEVRISWDMKRAQAAGLGAKDMWKKYPRQMLRARTVSEGIRTVCPMATSGMYVPEEVQDFSREKDITPTAGAGESLNPEQMQKIAELADKVHTFISDGAMGDAVVEINNAALDTDEKVYLWTYFDSKERSAMKKEVARQKKAAEEKAIEVEPDANVSVISAAAHKRLEARITELGLNRESVKKRVLEKFAKQHFTELTQEEYNALDEELPGMMPLLGRIKSCKTIEEVKTLKPEIAALAKGQLRHDAIELAKAIIEELEGNAQAPDITSTSGDVAMERIAAMPDDLPFKPSKKEVQI